MYKIDILNINNTVIQIRDLATSNTAKWVETELNAGDYNFDKIPFKPGDYVIDVGANIGITAIYLAKKFPFLKIYCYEPLIDNYINLLHNRWLNGTPNIYCFNMAIGGKFSLVDIIINKQNTGGSYTAPGQSYPCRPLMNEMEIIAHENNGRMCKLLKIDCEGNEIDIFSVSGYETKVEYLSMETHGLLPKHIIKNINLFNKEKLWIKKA